MSTKTLLASPRRTIAPPHENRPREASRAPTATFSIIIPTYNEAQDIGDTLAAVFAQSLPAIDIILVDGGSTDATVSRVRQRDHDRRVTIIEERRRRGVATARNAGMRRATGDVVVLLNADVLLPCDFLERLAALYAADVDLVSVQSRVANTECVAGRYLEASHNLKYSATTVGWSEGFSCRRAVALAAGFPEEIPGAGGEDVEFVERLVRGGGRWIADHGIVVEHRVPATLRGFWAQFAGRGRAVPFAERYLRHRSLPVVTVRRVAATMLSLLVAASIVPHAITAARLARRSPRGWREAPRMWFMHHLLIAAHRCGEFETLRRMWRDDGRAFGA